eukprot:scaffold26457_cov117-Isochrysis_galbana.AAC.1
MFATVHAAGSSLLGLFTSCTTFDSTVRGDRGVRVLREAPLRSPVPPQLPPRSSLSLLPAATAGASDD